MYQFLDVFSVSNEVDLVFCSSVWEAWVNSLLCLCLLLCPWLLQLWVAGFSSWGQFLSCTGHRSTGRLIPFSAWFIFCHHSCHSLPRVSALYSYATFCHSLCCHSSRITTLSPVILHYNGTVLCSGLLLIPELPKMKVIPAAALS